MKVQHIQFSRPDEKHLLERRYIHNLDATVKSVWVLFDFFNPGTSLKICLIFLMFSINKSTSPQTEAASFLSFHISAFPMLNHAQIPGINAFVHNRVLFRHLLSSAKTLLRTVTNALKRASVAFVDSLTGQMAGQLYLQISCLKLFGRIRKGQ